jgi:hypothetical protein
VSDQVLGQLNVDGEFGPYKPAKNKSYGFGLLNLDPSRWKSGESLPKLLKHREERNAELKVLEEPDTPYTWIGTVFFICMSAWRSEASKSVKDACDFYSLSTTYITRMQGIGCDEPLSISFLDFFDLCYHRAGLYASFVAHCVMHAFQLKRCQRGVLVQNLLSQHPVS